MKLYKSQEEAEEKYKEYIEHHKQNVMDAFNLLTTLDIPFINENKDEIQEICSVHDDSKYSDKEFFPYLHHFYPTTKEESELEEEFDHAVMLHVQNNRHHWDCIDWIDPKTGNLKGGFDENLYKIHCVERVCDFAAMSFQHGQDYISWWNANKDGMIMPDWAKQFQEDLLLKINEINPTFSFRLTRGELDENYKVYEHLFPNGKRYIGITKKELNERFRDGKAYGWNTRISNAIKKYGWDSIQHNLLCEGLTKDEACEKEKYYISKYKSNMFEYGYNLTDGGEHYNPNEDVRKKISISVKESISKVSDDEKKSWYNKRNTEFFNSNEYRNKISKKSKEMWENRTLEEKEDISDIISNKISNKWKDNQYRNNIMEGMKNNGNRISILCDKLDINELRRILDENNIPYNNKSNRYILYTLCKNKLGIDVLDEEFVVTKGIKGYLIEATMSQLKNKTISEDPTRAKKSKNVQSKYLGISKYGVLNFSTTSETHSGVQWYQEIQFPSFQGFMNIVQQGDTISADDVKKAMQSDNLKLTCDDPSFLYWAWKYKAWRDVYGLDKETRAPKRNNPHLQGALCKHLYSVVELVNEKRIIDLIARDLNEWCRRQLGIENQGYQDTEGMMQKDFKANQYDYNIEDVLKDLLPQDKFNKYMNGTPLEDLELTQEELDDIDDAIKHMRDSSQYSLRTELEKQLAPAKRGRKITREDRKLEVKLKSEEEEEK